MIQGNWNFRLASTPDYDKRSDTVDANDRLEKPRVVDGSEIFTFYHLSHLKKTLLMIYDITSHNEGS